MNECMEIMSQKLPYEWEREWNIFAFTPKEEVKQNMLELHDNKNNENKFNLMWRHDPKRPNKLGPIKKMRKQPLNEPITEPLKFEDEIEQIN